MKLRERVLAELAERGVEALDVGARSPEPRVDYPDKARELAEAMRAGGAHAAEVVRSPDLVPPRRS